MLPALADLQHECAATSGRALRQRFICWRAYWSVWKTLGVCLVADIVRDPHGVGRTIGRRTLQCLAALILVPFVPVVPHFFSPQSRFTVGEALTAAVLLLPPAVLGCLPAAFFFALALYLDEDRPRGAPIIPSLVAGTLACMLVVGFLAVIVVPPANQEIRMLEFGTLERRATDYALPAPSPPAKGVSEMTWWELNAQIANPTSDRAESLARARRREHLAFVGLVPVLALLGYALSNRGRSRAATFGIALTLQTACYVCFSLGASNVAKPYLYGPWTVNAALSCLGLWLLRTPSRGRVARTRESGSESAWDGAGPLEPSRERKPDTTRAARAGLYPPNQKLTLVLNVIRRTPSARVGCRKSGDNRLPLNPE